MTADVQALTARMLEDLRDRGIPTSDRLAEAFTAAPRHLFVPPVAWAHPDKAGAQGHRIDAETDPSTWWETVYSDASIIIQTDDGIGDPASGQGMSSSSVSAPGVVAQFLELLDAQPHQRVLDVGTGSGWTACLLSALGCKVTSIEVDPAVAAQAAANVKAAGFTPHLVVGDGAVGYSEAAPYDRVHFTAGVPVIPAACIAQTRPGGLIVLPWQPGGPIGHKLQLIVTGARTATGTFHGPANYMTLRAQRPNTTWNPHHGDDADVTSTRLDPQAVAQAGLGAQLAITAQVPGIGWSASADRETGGFSFFLHEITSAEGSWAGCYRQAGADDNQVVQYGERRLWDEVETAFLAWCNWGRPNQDRFGIAIDGDELALWLAIRPGSSAAATADSKDPRYYETPDLPKESGGSHAGSVLLRDLLMAPPRRQATRAYGPRGLGC